MTQEQFHPIDDDVQQMDLEQLTLALADIRARRDKVASDLDDIMKQFQLARLDYVSGGEGANHVWREKSKSLRNIKEASLRKINRRMQGMERRYGQLTREQRASIPKTGDHLFVQAANIILDKETIDRIWKIVRSLSVMQDDHIL